MVNHRLIVLAFIAASSLCVDSTSIKPLQGQRATDIADTPEHVTEYKTQGDLPHISFDAYELKGGVAATKKLIRKMMVDGLRERFGKFKKTLTREQDKDGIVREGIVFCNANNDNDIDTPEAGYHASTGRLVEYDGFGQGFNETGVCTVRVNNVMKDQCDEASFVGGLANMIRSMGLMVQHQDICDSVINRIPCNGNENDNGQPLPLGCIEFPNAFTTTLQPYTYGTDNARYEHACGTLREFDGARQSHFERNLVCFGKDKEDCEAVRHTKNGIQVQSCAYFPRERGCFATESKDSATGTFDETTNPNGCDIAPKDYWNKIPFDDGNIVNAVRRATSYGLTQLSVESTDYEYVTGCDATATQPYTDVDYPYATGPISKCGNLRSLVTALNGNAQINAFRDTSIEEAGAHWGKQVAVIKSYLVDFAYTLSNFRTLSLQIFPYIENEEIRSECPMGATEFATEETGTVIEPLCYRSNNDLEKLLGMDKTGQGFNRLNCFCRNGKLGRAHNVSTPADGDYDPVLLPNHFAEVERDDIYLSVELNSKETCNELMPVSVFQYCGAMGDLGDIPTWRNTLESLLPAATESRSKVYSHISDTVLQERRKIRNHLESTLPSFLDTSCGRIVSADSDTSTVPSLLRRSNKGANCMPFDKLYDVIYRLEFETGKQDMGDYVNSDAVNSSNPLFEDYYCSPASFTERAYSFRQLTYKWDTARVNEDNIPAAKKSAVSEVDGQLWFDIYDTPADTGNFKNFEGRYTSRYLVNGVAPTGLDAEGQGLVDAAFCHIDWIQQVGGDVMREDSAGTKFKNPYPLLKKEIDEAVFNAKMAWAAKTVVREDNVKIWAFIEEQLTDNRENNIIETIGHRAGEHYMRIWLDENSDSP